MIVKNKYGQYFTIAPVADFMVSLISHSKTSKVLEPSCGKGVFIDKLVNSGFTNISAYEIDKKLATDYDFVRYSSFLEVSTEEKYDVIIGNPPYIRWKNLEPELKEELKDNDLWNKYFNSLCDYLFIFILKSIEHLSPGGELIFICTEYWLNTTHSSSLRDYMCSNGYFSDIYHFNETPLFEKVTASFVIFRYIKSSERIETINLHRYIKGKKQPTKRELLEEDSFVSFKIPHFRKGKRWILADLETQSKLMKFERACISSKSDCLFEDVLHTIGDYCDIGNGMVSGLDTAFQIKETSHLNENESKCLIPVLKAKDLTPYLQRSSSTYIFISEKISASNFKVKYPNLHNHFSPYLEKLDKRYKYNKDIPYWEFVFPRNQKLFKKEEAKIFIPCKERISNKKYFRFCYARPGFFPTQDVTAIVRKNQCRESVEYILAFLNNKRVFDWLSLNGIVKGNIVEFSEAPISKIPFRRIDWEISYEKTLHDDITKEVQAYLMDKDESHIDTVNKLFNTLFNE